MIGFLGLPVPPARGTLLQHSGSGPRWATGLTYNDGTLSVSSVAQTPAMFLHPDDSDMHVRLQAGLSADQRAYFAWWKQGAANYSWLLGKNGSNEFIGYDADGTTHRLHMVSAGVTRLCSAGTAAVAINNYGEATTGSGGFEVYSGGVGPTKWFGVNSSGVTIWNLTSGRVPFIGTSGLIQDSSKFKYSDSSPALTLGPGTGAPAFVIDGGAGSERRILFRSGGAGRWDFYVSGTAEAGANAGSDFVINARDDAGATIDAAFTITRAAGGAVVIATGRTLKIGSNQVVGARKTGWAVASGTATRTTFDTATVTLPQLAERVKALIDDFHATAGHGLIGT